MAITAKRISVELRRLGAEYPDAVYAPLNGGDITAASYLTGGTQYGRGCIFGQAFRNLGVDDAVLVAVDNKTAAVVARHVGVKDKVIPPWWDRVQEQQDAGVAWGDIPELKPRKKEKK